MIYNAAILKNGRWSGVEWAVWQRAVELASGKSPDEFVFLVAKGVTLPSPLPGGRIVRLPRFAGSRFGRIFYELFLMPRLVRRESKVESRKSKVREQGTRNREQGKNLLSTIYYLLSTICDAGEGKADGPAVFFAPAYVAPPRRPCPYTLCLYDLHVYTHPQFCTWLNRLHYRWRMPGSIRRAQTIEVPSEHVRDILLERFPEAAGKTVVRHLALRERFNHSVTDAEKAAVRDKYGLPSRYILFVGAPAPRKNLPAALAAWRAICADPGKADLGFVIAGHIRYLPSPISHLPSPICVGDASGVPDADMPALYACASVLLYPSFDEGYGLPIIEARACGCPVVTSSPTAREIAPNAFLCGTDEASITAALRASLVHA
jgi:glycosyltransferase involved in cell wall biosynthesis